jgi:hypothetical protein
VSVIPTRPRLISMLGVDLACHDEATMTMNASALLRRSKQEGLLDAAKVGSALQRVERQQHRSANIYTDGLTSAVDSPQPGLTAASSPI